MLGDIQHERRFSHGRPGRYQYQIRRLHPRRAVIQIHKSRRNSRNASLISGSLFYLFHGIHDHLANRYEVFRTPPLDQMKNPLLRILQYRFQAFFSHITSIGNLFVHLNQTPEHSLFGYDIGIMLDICRSRHRSDQISDIFRAAYLWRNILFPQPVLQSNQIHRFPFIIQLYHRFKESPALFAVKIFFRHYFRSCHNRILVHDHSSDHRLFRLYAVGQYSFQQRFFHCCHFTSSRLFTVSMIPFPVLLLLTSRSPGDAASPTPHILRGS